MFGSNLANVLRRLLRLCDFYGSHPQFILCSATIANPKELAETLTGREVSLVDDNGAPMGVRHFVFYNPPVVNRQLGIRKGVLQETRRIAGLLLQNGIQAITFARSRLAVEVLTKYLKDMVRDPLGNAGRVRGYRGGYLPTERRWMRACCAAIREQSRVHGSRRGAPGGVRERPLCSMSRPRRRLTSTSCPTRII